MCSHEPNKLNPEPVLDVEERRIVLEPDAILEPDVADLISNISSPVSSAFPNEQFCNECSLYRENSELKCEKGFWKRMHQKALERESKLKQEKAELEAKLRLREKQLFKRKSEKSSGTQGSSNKPKGKPKPRGQQQGSRGHGRRDYSELPAKTEIIRLSEEETTCSNCGRRYEEFSETEDSEILEIKVKAHRRIIKRKKYFPPCHCHEGPGMITSPVAPRILPKGIFGISVWVHILIDKYRFMRPTNRLLDDLRTHNLDIAQGTVTGGLKRIAPVFKPVYEALVVKNIEEQRWHADETRWYVFASIDGKIGYRWYLWVFISESTVVYRLDPSRSAEVPEKHFDECCEGFLNVDRYSAYKAMAKNRKIVLVYCWSHVRRDFLDVANKWPEHEKWGMQWVELIGEIYHLNKARLEVLDCPEAFALRDEKLRQAVDAMADRMESELKDEKKHHACKKVLESLNNHWEGLTVFVDHPEIPMDNNKAERHLRGPVVGRKNYYGSGSEWSGQLAAVMFSIFQTLEIFGLNPRLWLQMYLQVCAENGGKAPEDVREFLPWNLSDRQKTKLSLKPAIHDSS